MITIWISSWHPAMEQFSDYLERLFVISGGFLNLESPDVRATSDRNKQQGEDEKPMFNPVGRVKSSCWSGVSFFWDLGQGGWSLRLELKRKGSCWGQCVGRRVILRWRGERFEVRQVTQ